MGTTFSLKRKKKKITLKRVDQNSDLSFDKNDYIERKRKKKPKPPSGPPPPKQKYVLLDKDHEFLPQKENKDVKLVKKVKRKIKKVIIPKKKKPVITHNDDEHEYVYDEELKEYDEDIFEYDLDEFTNTDNIKLL